MFTYNINGMKPAGSTAQPASPGPGRWAGILQFGLMAVLLLGVLLLLFWKALKADYTVFSNDGPLGQLCADWAKLPSALFGCWEDLNWLGSAMPTGFLSVATSVLIVLGPLWYSKLWAALAILFLGLSAWLCFRQWKFSPAACLLGGLAAALNSDCFSPACWGVASQTLSFGLDFLALAALADLDGQPVRRRWVRVMLAGIVVGMAVTEAADIGAMFSVFVGAFVVFQALTSPAPGEADAGRLAIAGRRLARGLGRLAVVAGFAALAAAGALSTMIGTQVQGIAGMGQDAASKARRWNEATQWSLPKKETLGLLVPGLFGFRMDTPQDMAVGSRWFRDGQYWGAVGQDVAWEDYLAQRAAGKEVPQPNGPFPRQTGGGSYAGVLVVIIALWGVAQSFRRANGSLSIAERRFIYFWLGGAVVSLLMAFGRHAPLYRFLYALPYASLFRSPAKFIHVASWILVILFGYGLENLCRQYLPRETEAGEGEAQGFDARVRAWWSGVTTFDKNWIRGTCVALAAAVAALVVYAGKAARLVAYLQEAGFDAARSRALAAFSLRQAGWFLLLLTLALTLVAAILIGFFKGRRTWVGKALLGLLIAGDLVVANLPWVVIYNWKQTYAPNAIVDFLREKPFEQRVSLLPLDQLFDLSKLPPILAQSYITMRDLYGSEWVQHLFQYYNVQSLDVIQLPRVPVDYLAYETTVGTTPLRHWELTNTRYLLCLALPPDQLNQLLDPVHKSFKILKLFRLDAKASVTGPIVAYNQLTAEPSTDGPLALFEYGAALPRAKLYTHWQVSTNDQESLKQLVSPGFDSARVVLVANPLPPPPPAPLNTNPPAGTVQFASYAPKRLVLRAQAAAASVLLLNDKFDPGWKVTVDGKPAPLLRCNYVMRGVQVPPGEHQIEFSFAAPVLGLYVSLVTIGAVLLLFLVFSAKADPRSTARRPEPGAECQAKGTCERARG